MSLRDEILRDQRLEERESEVLVWGGQRYPCRLGSVEAVKELEDGGHTVIAQLRVHVRMVGKLENGDPFDWDWTTSGGPQEGDSVQVGTVDQFNTTVPIGSYKAGNSHRISERILAFNCEDTSR